MNKIKTPFMPNVWVKCMHNNEICLGRTYLQVSEFKKIKGLQLVCLISENCQTKLVPFSEITKVAILKIYTAFDFETENSIKKTCDGQKTKPFDLVRILSQCQLKTKMS